MNKRSVRSNRFLPEYVTRFKDRHGKERLRFRRKGYPSQYFTAPLGTEEFREEYRRFNSLEAKRDAIEETRAARTVHGSIGDLLHRYRAVPTQLGPSKETQDKIRSILERFAKGKEDWPVNGVKFDHINAIIAKEMVKRPNEKGRMLGGPEAARKLRKELRRLFAFAKKLRWIADNPVEESDPVKLPPAERSTGFYTWAEEDIAQYRAHWALGTKQRLAMELMLWSAQRKCDAIHLGRQHVRNGKFVIRQKKHGKDLILPISGPLRAAIDAMPPSDSMCFLNTEWGKPFTKGGFGNWFREQCEAAGVAGRSHGLRKAAMRRMAERQIPYQSMKAVSGHSKDDEVARYTRAADQARLAEEAILEVEKWEMSNPSPKLDTKSA